MRRLRFSGSIPGRERIVPYAIAITVSCLLAALFVFGISLFLSDDEAVVINVVPIGEPDRLQVQVEGAVVHPGVYALPVGSTALDAVAAAGGATEDAQIDAIQSGAVVEDGGFLYVPSSADQAGERIEPLDINVATSAELETLTGIGPVLAERIVQYRQANGSFASVDELANVSGISDRMVGELRDQIIVASE